MPTPGNDIKVRWERNAHDFRLEVTVPEGKTAREFLPEAPDYRVGEKKLEDSGLVWEQTSDGLSVVVPQGAYNFAACNTKVV